MEQTECEGERGGRESDCTDFTGEITGWGVPLYAPVDLRGAEVYDMYSKIT